MLILVTGFAAYMSQGIDSGSKRSLAMKSGAEAFFDFSSYPAPNSAKLLATDVIAATSFHDGAAAVIVCTASNASYAQALSFLQVGGTVVCLGIPEGARQPIATADPSSILEKDLIILGSSVGNRKDAIEVLDMAARGIVKTHFEVRPMSQLEQVFREMEDATLQGRVVLDLEQE